MVKIVNIDNRILNNTEHIAIDVYVIWPIKLSDETKVGFWTICVNWSVSSINVFSTLRPCRWNS